MASANLHEGKKIKLKENFKGKLSRDLVVDDFAHEISWCILSASFKVHDWNVEGLEDGTDLKGLMKEKQKNLKVETNFSKDLRPLSIPNQLLEH